MNFAYFYTIRHLWKPDLNTYRVEAAWKLGRWDLLEDYLGSGMTVLKCCSIPIHS